MKNKKIETNENKTEVVLEDETKIYVCECCGGRNIQIEAWVDGNTKKYISDIDDSWCDDCQEHNYFDTLEEYKEKMLKWWQSLNPDEKKRLSDSSEDPDSWWESRSFDQRRTLYKEIVWDKNDDDDDDL